MYVRMHEPRAVDWRSFTWNAGSFDTARRPDTRFVEGTIRIPDHLILVTLRGGAERLQVETDCGHRFVGPDRPGAVSFVPAGCERRMSLVNVRSEWASIALRPGWLAQQEDIGGFDCPAFSNSDDPFVAGLMAEFARLFAIDGVLNGAYCEAMSFALVRYLDRRYRRRAQQTHGEATRSTGLATAPHRRLCRYAYQSRYTDR
jgi:AraC family transcriptional regulator